MAKPGPRVSPAGRYVQGLSKGAKETKSPFCAFLCLSLERARVPCSSSSRINPHRSFTKSRRKLDDCIGNFITNPTITGMCYYPQFSKLLVPVFEKSLYTDSRVPNKALLDWKFVSWFCFVWELVCVCVFSFFSCGDWFSPSFGVLVWWTSTPFSLKQFFMRLRFFWSFFYKPILLALLNVCFLFRFRVLGVFAVTGDLLATEMSLYSASFFLFPLCADSWFQSRRVWFWLLQLLVLVTSCITQQRIAF